MNKKQKTGMIAGINLLIFLATIAFCFFGCSKGTDPNKSNNSSSDPLFNLICDSLKIIRDTKTVILSRFDTTIYPYDTCGAPGGKCYRSCFYPDDTLYCTEYIVNKSQYNIRNFQKMYWTKVDTIISSSTPDSMKYNDTVIVGYSRLIGCHSDIQSKLYFDYQ